MFTPKPQKSSISRDTTKNHDLTTKSAKTLPETERLQRRQLV